MTAEFELPWPPSVNHYYRHVGPRVLISRDGRKYRERVVARFHTDRVAKYTGPVELDIELIPRIIGGGTWTTVSNVCWTRSLTRDFTRMTVRFTG